MNGTLEGLTGIERLANKLPGVQSLTRDGIKQLLATPTAREAVLSYARNVGSTMLEEGVTEALQSMVTKAGEVFAQASKDGGSPLELLGKMFNADTLNQAVAEGRAGAQGGGGTAAVLSAPIAAADLRRVKDAKETAQAFQNLGTVAQSSTLPASMPGTVRAILEQATKDGPLDTLYVPTDAFNTYFQSKGVDPRAVAEELTGNVEAYDLAMQTGQDLAIPTAEYAEKIAPTEHNSFFAHEIRPSLDAMNAREADEWIQAREIENQALADQVRNAQDPMLQVRQDIAGQLETLGFDQTVVDQYAQLFASRYQARAERRGLGEDPFALFQQTGLTIQRVLPDILKTLGGNVSQLDVLLDRLRSGDVPTERQIYGPSLLDALQDKGGLLDQGGELSALGVDEDRKPFAKTLIREGGLALDRAAELMHEAGYLEERDIGTLLAGIESEVRGAPVFRSGRENPNLYDLSNQLRDLKQYLDELQLPLDTTPNEAIKTRLEGHLQAATRSAAEGETFAQAGEGSTRFQELAALERTMRRVRGSDQARALKQVLVGPTFTNEETGLTATVSSESWRKMLSRSAVDRSVSPQAHFQALGNLDHLFRLAMQESQRAGKKVTDQHLKALHHFAVPMPFEGTVLRVDMTVKEFHAQEAGNRIYLVEAVEIHGAGVVGEGPVSGRLQRAVADAPSPPPSTSDRFAQMVWAVKSGLTYFQSAGDDAKGSITFGRGQIDIRLLEGADLSTFIHETGHLYLNELIDDATTAGTSEQLRTDLDTVLAWMGLDVRSAAGAEAIKAAIGREHHEQFARGFEAYALEGNSPSQAMREVFARFRQWLIQVYKLMTFRGGATPENIGQALHVQLTKEVRKVMNRMVATEEEIAAMEQEAAVLPLFTDAFAAGMTEREFEDYKTLVGKAGMAAREQLQAQLLGQLQRERTSWYQAKRDDVKAEVTAEANRHRDYIALAVLQTGKMPDGSDLPEGITPGKLDRKAVERLLGKDFVKRLPKGVTGKNGVSPVHAANLFGYDSAEAMLTALASARPKRQLIEAETDHRMQRDYGDPLIDGTLHDKARMAVLNDEREQIIAAELRALRTKQREVAPFVKAEREQTDEAEREGRGLVAGLTPPLQQVRELAERTVRRQTIREIKPQVHWLAAQRASRQATEALANKDYVVAGFAKQRELLSLALFRESTAALEETQQLVDLMASLRKKSAQERLGKAGGDYREQILALMSRYEFSPIPLVDLDRRRMAPLTADIASTSDARAKLMDGDKKIKARVKKMEAICTDGVKNGRRFAP